MKLAVGEREKIRDWLVEKTADPPRYMLAVIKELETPMQGNGVSFSLLAKQDYLKEDYCEQDLEYVHLELHLRKGLWYLAS